MQRNSNAGASSAKKKQLIIVFFSDAVIGSRTKIASSHAVWWMDWLERR